MATESSESPLPPVPELVEDNSDTARLPEAKKSKLSSVQEPDSSSNCTPAGELEVELVQCDELDFLDGATRLAILQTELNDVQRGLMLRRNQDQYVPFRLFRHWGHRVVSVTDLSNGVWCEVQVEYRHLHPHLKSSKEWAKMAEKGSPVVLKTDRMRMGSVIHMKKELQVHEMVEVESVTKEDRIAVQLVSTYAQLATIKAGKIERELSVFCDPFDLGILVRGVIDQLQYSPESGELILMDNKTRRTKCMPGAEQQKGTRLQLMLYKYMLDHMCLGITKPALLYKHLHLDRDTCLTKGPLDYICNCGLSSMFSDEAPNSNGSSSRLTRLKFGALADCILQHIAGLSLPLVGSLMVHYEHQDSGEILGVVPVEYDEPWMKTEVEKSVEFWAGERAARGVDIEDTSWKCCSCQFKDICVWKLKRELENSPAAKLSSLQ